jgi:hypothetical protein
MRKQYFQEKESIEKCIPGVKEVSGVGNVLKSIKKKPGMPSPSIAGGRQKEVF